MFHVMNSSTLWIIIKGFTIGILVSVPMGPVGLLCIQKTLDKGRWHGFFSGLGASFSDFLYAIIASTSMGIVIDFIKKNQLILQILGSILLFAFSMYTFLNNPSIKLKKAEKEIKLYSHSQGTLAVFLLAFSNPFVLFLFISLFNGFNLLLGGKSLYIIILGLSCIFMGNLLWWFTITYFVAKLRRIFNIQRLYIMNKIIGIIIMFLAFGIAISSLIEYGMRKK